MEISILTENTVYRRGFLAEHGLSLLVKTETHALLFDTGQTGVFHENARRMGIDLSKLDGIILSHGHYDHCGGLGAWMEQEEVRVPVYVNRKAFERKYTENPGTGELREIGIAWDKDRCGKYLRLSEGGRVEILRDVFLVSKIPGSTEFEPYSQLFWKDTGGEKMGQDYMEDEQLLVIRTEKGLHVFAGCAHPGIINCMKYVIALFPGEHIYSLMAGMHLKGAGKDRIQKTSEALMKMEIDVVVPMHCTGIMGIAGMKEELGERCIIAEAGKKVVI